MIRMNIARTSMAAAAALALAAAPAAAQVCAGYPNAPGQTSFGLRAGFPDGATKVGVEASRQWTSPLGAFANANILMPDADGADNITVLGAGLSYDVGGMVSALPAWLSMCPVAAVNYSTVNDVNMFQIPVGLGFGMSIAATENVSVHPFAIPQFIMSRSSADELEDTDDFGIGAGAMVKFRGVYGGVTLGKVFVDGSDTDITFSGGLTFPAGM